MRTLHIAAIVLLIAACATAPRKSAPESPLPPPRELVEFEFRGVVEEVDSASAPMRAAIAPGDEIRGTFRWATDTRAIVGGSPELTVYLVSGEDVGQELRIGNLEMCSYAQSPSSTATVRRNDPGEGDRLIVAQDCAQPPEIDAGSNYVEGIIALEFASPTSGTSLSLLAAELRFDQLESAEVTIAAYPTERAVPSVPLISLRTEKQLYRIRGRLDSLTRVGAPPVSAPGP